jgi:hypothetical protein
VNHESSHRITGEAIWRAAYFIANANSEQHLFADFYLPMEVPTGALVGYDAIALKRQ